MSPHLSSRRSFLAGAVSGGVLGLAGCVGGSDEGGHSPREDLEPVGETISPDGSEDVTLRDVSVQTQFTHLDAASHFAVGGEAGRVYRRSRPSASGLDPEGEGRTLY